MCHVDITYCTLCRIQRYRFQFCAVSIFNAEETNQAPNPCPDNPYQTVDHMYDAPDARAKWFFPCPRCKELEEAPETRATLGKKLKKVEERRKLFDEELGRVEKLREWNSRYIKREEVVFESLREKWLGLLREKEESEKRRDVLAEELKNVDREVASLERNIKRQAEEMLDVQSVLNP